jgi:hypothetical protein
MRGSGHSRALPHLLLARVPLPAHLDKQLLRILAMLLKQATFLIVQVSRYLDLIPQMSPLPLNAMTSAPAMLMLLSHGRTCHPCFLALKPPTMSPTHPVAAQASSLVKMVLRAMCHHPVCHQVPHLQPPQLHLHHLACLPPPLLCQLAPLLLLKEVTDGLTTG